MGSISISGLETPLLDIVMSTKVVVGKEVRIFGERPMKVWLPRPPLRNSRTGEILQTRYHARKRSVEDGHVSESEIGYGKMQSILE